MKASDLSPPPWFTYDDPHHVYFCDGVPLRGVTETISEAGYGPDYDAMPPFITRNVIKAAWRSDLVHRTFAESFLGLADIDSVHPVAHQQIEAALRLAVEYRMDAVALEHAVVSRAMWLGGRLDFLGLVKGRYALVDLKGTAKLDEPYCALQLTSYMKLVQATLARNGAEAPNFDLWVMHLPWKKTARMVPLRADETGFRMMVHDDDRE